MVTSKHRGLATEDVRPACGPGFFRLGGQGLAAQRLTVDMRKGARCDRIRDSASIRRFGRPSVITGRQSLTWGVMPMT